MLILATVSNKVMYMPSGAEQASSLLVIQQIPYGRQKSERFALYATRDGIAKRPLLVLIPGVWQQAGGRNPYPAVARALAQDGVVVAVVEYGTTNAIWPKQIWDLQAAVAEITRQVPPLGGDPQRLILWGDGWGAFLATHLMNLQTQERWLATSGGNLVAWMVNDPYWVVDQKQQLPRQHPWRRFLPSDTLFPPHMVMREESLREPGFVVVVQNGASSLGSPLADTERLMQQKVQGGGDITLLLRPERGSRLWQGIAKADHPLRVSWRPWLQRFKQY
ncbi:MAG: carboxylesterase family protein [Symbiobacteriaceae bacterium]|nr:carboxylesterase family protein [Symbiobacteriaceae bacterium]